MGIKSILVNGTSYKIDYDALENKPDLTKDTTPTTGSEHYITSGAVAAALISIQQRLAALEGNGGGNQGEESGTDNNNFSKSVDGEKLSLSGSNTDVSGEKLSVTGSEFTVTGEKLSIA